MRLGPIHRLYLFALFPLLFNLLWGASLVNAQSDCLDPAVLCSYFDNSAGNGNWNDPLNWDTDTLPAAMPTMATHVIVGGAFGANPAVANIDGPLTNSVIGDLRIGASMAFDVGGNVGTLNHSAGSLQTDSGNWAFVGVDGNNNTGTYNLSGTASFMNTGELHVGIGGDETDPNTGTINISDQASLSTNQFRFGTNNNAVGTMNQSGGTVTALQGFLGDAEGFGGAGVPGTGIYNQTGGDVVIQDWLALGRISGATGTYNMSGGTLSVGVDYLTVGENGNGTMDVSGTADVDTASLGIGRFGGGAVGLLRIVGDSPSIDVTGNENDGTPGVLNIGRNDQGAIPFEPTDATGTIEFVATAGGISPINVNGDVYLNDGSSGLGAANLVVDFSAMTGTGHVPLINISGALDGAFVGLNEGDLVPNSGGRTITYVGGDGNDIYLLGQMTGVNGDFNGDMAWNCSDIDALVAEIVAGTNNAAFDMNGDGLVNASDVIDGTDGWLTVGGANNPSQTGGNAFLTGDANLDGVVDVSDYGIYLTNKFNAAPAWCSGDFNTDGFVDVSDLGLWNAFKFQSSQTPSVVPEPSAAVLLLIGFVAFAVRRWIPLVG